MFLIFRPKPLLLAPTALVLLPLLVLAAPLSPLQKWVLYVTEKKPRMAVLGVYEREVDYHYFIKALAQKHNADWQKQFYQRFRVKYVSRKSFASEFKNYPLKNTREVRLLFFAADGMLLTQKNFDQRRLPGYDLFTQINGLQEQYQKFKSRPDNTTLSWALQAYHVSMYHLSQQYLQRISPAGLPQKERAAYQSLLRLTQAGLAR